MPSINELIIKPTRHVLFKGTCEYAPKYRIPQDVIKQTTPMYVITIQREHNNDIQTIFLISVVRTSKKSPIYTIFAKETCLPLENAIFPRIFDKMEPSIGETSSFSA